MTKDERERAIKLRDRRQQNLSVGFSTSVDIAQAIQDSRVDNEDDARREASANNESALSKAMQDGEKELARGREALRQAAVKGNS